MSEQNASTQEAANSSQETGTQQQDEAQVNWQKRFEDTQAWGTQSAQEATKFRQEADELRQREEQYRTFLTTDDPEARREAADALGFELPDEEPDEFADPNEELRRRLDAHEARFEQMTQAEQQQAVFNRDVAHIGESLTALGKELQRDLTPHEVQLLGDAAWQNRDEQGLPNIAAVIEMAKPMLAAQPQPRPRAPHVPGSGQAATHVPELETRAQIADYIAAEVAKLDED